MAESRKILQNNFDTDTDVLVFFFPENNPTLQGKEVIFQGKIEI